MGETHLEDCPCALSVHLCCGRADSAKEKISLWLLIARRSLAHTQKSHTVVINLDFWLNPRLPTIHLAGDRSIGGRIRPNVSLTTPLPRGGNIAPCKGHGGIGVLLVVWWLITDSACQTQHIYGTRSLLTLDARTLTKEQR